MDNEKMENAWFDDPPADAYDAPFPLTVKGFNLFRDSEMDIDEEMSTIVYDDEEHLRIEYNYWKNPIFTEQYKYGTAKTWNSMFPSSLLMRLMRSMCYTDYMAMKPMREVMPRTEPESELQWGFMFGVMLRMSWWGSQLPPTNNPFGGIDVREEMPIRWEQAITKALWGGKEVENELGVYEVNEDSMYMRASEEQREVMDKISMHFWAIHGNLMGMADFRDYGIINFTTDDVGYGGGHYGLSSETHLDVEHDYSHKTLRALIEQLEYPQVFSWWNDGRMD